MTLPVSLTQDQFMTAVRTLLLDVLGSPWEVFQGQANRVPEPQGTDFVVMTPVRRERLSTNVDTWDMGDPDPSVIDRQHATAAVVQLDIHGDNGADAAQIIGTVMRDAYGVAALDGYNVTPLYANDGKQLPFKNAEGMYENRWVMEVTFQINPSVSTQAEFAATLSVSTLQALGG